MNEEILKNLELDDGELSLADFYKDRLLASRTLVDNLFDMYRSGLESKDSELLNSN